MRLAQLEADERRLVDARQYTAQITDLQAELRIERIAREAQAGRTEGELHLRYASEHAELMQLRAEMEAIRSAGTDEVRAR